MAKYKIKDNIDTRKDNRYERKEKEYEVTGKAKKLFEKWAEVDDAKSLKKNKLTVCEYNTILPMLHEIAQNGRTQTFIESIANWFERNGCTINPPCGDSVSFEVIL